MGVIFMKKIPFVISNFYSAFNTGDVSKLDSVLSLDWVNHPNDPGQLPNIDGFKSGIIDFRDAFSNFRLDIIKVIQELCLAINLQFFMVWIVIYYLRTVNIF